MPIKRKLLLRLGFALAAAVAAAVCGVVVLYILQDRMVYRVQRYGPGATASAASFRRSIVDLPYRTAGGKQIAFYLAPIAGGVGVPKRVWIMFGGNGAAILDYAGTVPDQAALASDGFLLVDYPGYGYNDGNPSAPAIAANASGAMDALATRLTLPPAQLYARTGAFGHSLGAAVALEFAQAHLDVSRVVLVSPFTSLYAVGFARVGPAALFLRHNYDNAAVLRELSRRNPRPSVVIFHGDQDQVVPVAMSRVLAAENKWLTYYELHGCEHSRIVREAAPQIAAAMFGLDKP